MLIIRVISSAVIFVAVVTAAPATAQSGSVGVGLVRFVDGGPGVDAACFHSTTRNGFSLRGGYNLGDYLSIQTNVNVHPFVTAADCVLAPEVPPPDGTYVNSIDRPLLAQRFATTDMRLAVTTPGMPSFVVTSGVGVAWLSGADAPYAVIGGAVAIPLGGSRLLVTAELYHIRVGFDQVERTWLNFDLVSSLLIGREHEWSSGVAVGFALELPDVF